MYIATKKINEELNGVELYFNVFPINGTKKTMRDAGFRWHRKKLCWYAKQSDKANTVADICAETSVEEYKEIAAESGEQVVEISERKSVSETKTESKASTTNKDGVKVGDVFYDSWGWEQTNIDFYQVVGLRGKTQIVLKAVKHESKPTAWCQADVRPLKDQFITGSYITHQQHDESGMIKRTGKIGDQVIAGSGRDTLYLTSWNVWKHETSYA